jgi:6-phosphofructokinase 1
MNAAIRAVTRSALDQGITVHGVLQGWQGLVDGQFRPLSARDVGGIIHSGGTFLGSARSAEFRTEAGRSKALRNLAQRGIEGVVVIGGNGSQTGSYMLSQLGVQVVGVASTIDNDLLGTDISIGCDTAINVTLEAIDHLRTTGSSHNRAFLVETMGRDCGYLAIMAGLAGGAEVISTPEFEVSASVISERLRAAYERGKTHAIVVLAEGVKENTAKILAYFDADKQRSGFELRATTLGHAAQCVRSGAGDAVGGGCGQVAGGRRDGCAGRLGEERGGAHAACGHRRAHQADGHGIAGAGTHSGEVRGRTLRAGRGGLG